MTIPTGPLIILVATTIGLEVAGRYGRRLQLNMDVVWNAGLFAILAGLIVARLWNVIQFWPIYIAEPWLIVSIRPSGFALLPGSVAAIVVVYGYMLRHALEPARVTTALGVGLVTALAIVQAGGLLTGTLVGIASDGPWALRYLGELRHPVALYYAFGLLVVVVTLWIVVHRVPPLHLLLFLLLGCGIVYLTFGAFEFQAAVVGGWRVKQVSGFLTALLSLLFLSRLPHSLQAALPNEHYS